MPNSITAKTGTAKVVKLGHTKNEMYGNSTNAQPKGRKPSTELSGK